MNFINKARKFEENLLYILKISNERLVNATKSILFIKRIIDREIDMSENKRIIILLLNILNNFINFELNIEFNEILKETRIRIKFNKLLIRKLMIFLNNNYVFLITLFL